jgi:hypothetical protein
MTEKTYKARLNDLLNLRDEVRIDIDMDFIQKTIYLSDIEWDIVCICDKLDELRTKKEKRMETLLVFGISLVLVLTAMVLVIKYL